MFAATACDAELWHRRLGHRNAADLRRLGELGVGVPANLRMGGVCDTCEVSKHTQRSFPKVAKHRATKPLQLVHTDLLGPMESESLGDAHYAMLFTDDATRWRMVYFMRQKSEALGKLKAFLEDAACLTDGRVKAMRSDNGGEFIGDEFRAYCRQQGVSLKPGGPYAPQQNGVTERSWRTVIEMARSLRSEAGLGKEIWAEAVNTAVYIINRIPTSSLRGDTPHHALFGDHAMLDHMRVFGCRVFVQVPKKQRKKLDDRAWRGLAGL